MTFGPHDSLLPAPAFARRSLVAAAGLLMWAMLALHTAPAEAKLALDTRAAATATLPLDASADKAPARAELWRSSLQSFMDAPGPINLRNASSEYTVSLPVAPRLQLRGATLHLVANNSTALLAPRSQLVVRLDGVVVAQVPLDARLPQIRASIGLPAALLQPGYNRLTFAVAQHYTNDCEDPSASELWTQIDTAQSWVALDGELRSWQPRLSQLSDVFDPKVWGPQRLTVLTAAAVTAQTLRQGGLAAQAAALRLGYAPLDVRHAVARAVADAAPGALRLDPALVPVGDAVLVGTAAELSPLLAAGQAAQIHSSYLAVVPLDSSRQRFVLVASGQDAAQVTQALQALTAMNFPYPDTSQTSVERMVLPELPDHAGRNMLYPNQTRSLAQLGLRTATQQGRYGQSVLQVTVPPDLYAPENAAANLKLRFAYGAGLREDSVLNIFLNDRFQAAIRLNAPDGGYFEDYKVAIPLVSFQPGANVIRFETAMMPLITGKCQDINARNLQFTLYGESSIELPNAAHLTTLPELSLLSRSGFPYTVPSRSSQTTVLVARPDSDTVAAAWTLVGRLSQVQKLPMDELAFALGTDPLPTGRDLIVVGAADQLSPSVLSKAPLKLGEQTQAPYPTGASVAGPGELGWLSRGWQAAVDLVTTRAGTKRSELTWLTQGGRSLGEQGVMMQYESPATAGRTLTLVSAATPQRLHTEMLALIDPGVWSGLNGDLVLWQGRDQLATQRVGAEYNRGQSGWGLQISYILSRHPVWWALALLLLVAGLAMLTLRLLMRFKHRRHPGVVEETGHSGEH